MSMAPRKVTLQGNLPFRCGVKCDSSLAVRKLLAAAASRQKLPEFLWRGPGKTWLTLK